MRLLSHDSCHGLMQRLIPGSKLKPLDSEIQCIVYPKDTTDAQMETICIVNDLIIQQVWYYSSAISYILLHVLITDLLY